MAGNIEPRKRGRQTRAKATEEAIVEAVARFLEEVGLEPLTTNKIAERAGVSIGSLYQYFPNKEAILVALIRRERSLLLADVAAIADSLASPQEKIEKLIGAGIKHQFARPRLALALEYVEQTVNLGEEAQDLERRLSEVVSGIVSQQFPDAGSHAPRDVVAMAQALINSSAMAGETDLEALRSRIIKAVYGYLD